MEDKAEEIWGVSNELAKSHVVHLLLPLSYSALLSSNLLQYPGIQ